MAVSVQSSETWFRNETENVCGEGICDFMGATPEKLDEQFAYTSPGGARVSGSHYRWSKITSSENVAQKKQWSLENFVTGMSWYQRGFTNLEGFTGQVDGVIGIAPNSEFVRIYMKSVHSMDTSSVSVYLGRKKGNVVLGGYYQSQGVRFKKLAVDASNPLTFTLESLHLKGDPRSFMLKQTVIIDSDTPYIQLPRNVLRVIMAHPNVQWNWNDDKSEIEFSDASSVGNRPSFEFDLGGVHIEMREEDYTTASGQPAFVESKDDFTIILGKPFLYTTYMVLDPFKSFLHLAQANPQPITPVAQDLTSLYASYQNDGDVGNEWEELPNKEEPHGHDTEQKAGNKKVIIIAVTVPVVVLSLLAVILYICYKRRKNTVTYVEEIEGYLNHPDRYGSPLPGLEGIMRIQAANLSASSVGSHRDKPPIQTSGSPTSARSSTTPTTAGQPCTWHLEDVPSLSQHPAFRPNGSAYTKSGTNGKELPLILGSRSAQASSIVLPGLSNNANNVIIVRPATEGLVRPSPSIHGSRVPSHTAAASVLSHQGEDEDEDYVDLDCWNDDTASIDRVTTADSSGHQYRVSASTYNSAYPLTKIRSPADN